MSWRVDELSRRATAAYIFLTALSLRLLLNLVFFYRYGRHAIQHKEVFYYLGVVRGIFTLPSLDPTTPILKGFCIFLPPDMQIYGIILAGIVLASLTAVLCFLLAEELYDRKTGFIAGMLYAFFSAPLSLNIAGFSHDIVQLPVLMLALLCGAMAFNRQGGARLILGILSILALYIGANINPVIILGGIVILFHIVHVGLLNLSNDSKQKAYIPSLVFVLFTLLLIRFVLLSGLMDALSGMAMEHRGINLGTQLGVARDLKPVEPWALLMGYNILWFILPFGIIRLYMEKREIVSFSLFATGIVAASAMSKGIRAADPGSAILVALAITSWKKEWFKKVYHLFVLTLLASLLFSPSSMTTVFLLILGATAMIEAMKLGEQKWKCGSEAALVVILITNLAIASYYSPANFTETEYYVFTWLGNNAVKGEKVLVPWDNGYAALVLSGLEPVASPERINKEAYAPLWQDESAAASALKKEGVRYVVVSEKDMKFRISGTKYYLYLGPATFSKVYAEGMDLEQAQHTLLFNLLYTEDSLVNFGKLHDVRDTEEDILYTAYEIE